jgi:N6-L-threonylcarbamoyladenine synthase
MTGHGEYERLGGTLDDAAGEAFDKVGRMLNLPFPGGPNIERAANLGNASAFDFPKAKTDDSYDFSFSGLKTAVMREVTVPPSSAAKRREKATDKQYVLRSDISVNDAAASFQRALVASLVEKTAKAAKAHKVSEVFMAGGVSANTALRQAMRAATELPVRYPPLHLCTDNAAMIAAAAHHRFLAGERDALDMDVKPMWPLSAGT